MPQGAGTVIEATIPVGAGQNVSVQCNLTGFISLVNYLTQFNVVLSTVRALSWVAQTLHRLHDFSSRSTTHVCAETLSRSLKSSSYFI